MEQNPPIKSLNSSLPLLIYSNVQQPLLFQDFFEEFFPSEKGLSTSSWKGGLSLVLLKSLSRNWLQKFYDYIKPECLCHTDGRK